MFRVEFFVDDKKLGNAIIALVGIAHGQPSVQPVVNVQKTANGLKPVTNGKATERLAQTLQKMKKGTVLDGAQFRQLLKTGGLNPVSASYHIREAKQAGLLKQSGKTSNVRYTVL